MVFYPLIEKNWMTAVIGLFHHATGWATLRLDWGRILLDLVRILNYVSEGQCRLNHLTITLYCGPAQLESCISTTVALRFIHSSWLRNDAYNIWNNFIYVVYIKDFTILNYCKPCCINIIYNNNIIKKKEVSCSGVRFEISAGNYNVCL